MPNPILGAILRFNADKNPNKVNLGQGVYRDENCQAVLLNCVKKADFKADAVWMFNFTTQFYWEVYFLNG